MSEPHAETAEAPRGLDAWLEADYQRTVRNLRADLTKAQLQASVLLEAVKGGLRLVDEADADCPVRHPELQRWRYRPRDPDYKDCPKCRASQSQNCGPEVSAYTALAAAVREAIASVESPTRKEEAR